jgi:hypothetical protein
MFASATGSVDPSHPLDQAVEFLIGIRQQAMDVAEGVIETGDDEEGDWNVQPTQAVDEGERLREQGVLGADGTVGRRERPEDRVGRECRTHERLAVLAGVVRAEVRVRHAPLAR